VTGMHRWISGLKQREKKKVLRQTRMGCKSKQTQENMRPSVNLRWKFSYTFQVHVQVISILHIQYNLRENAPSKIIQKSQQDPLNMTLKSESKSCLSNLTSLLSNDIILKSNTQLQKEQQKSQSRVFVFTCHV